MYILDAYVCILYYLMSSGNCSSVCDVPNVTYHICCFQSPDNNLISLNGLVYINLRKSLIKLKRIVLSKLSIKGEFVLSNFSAYRLTFRNGINSGN